MLLQAQAGHSRDDLGINEAWSLIMTYSDMYSFKIM
jgi:hypothetical protein